ncbi:MAG: hypothetical protein ACE5HU_02550 [Acidobacteriota bacterium]
MRRFKMMDGVPRALLALTAALAMSLSGCGTSAVSQDSPGPATAASAAGPHGSPVEAAYLTSAGWNDGKAEIAFYRARRSLKRPGGPPQVQSFLVGTYLVRHDFDPQAQSKAIRPTRTSIPSFKWALFYEVESTNSYQFKRAYVVNAAQADLHPLKDSFTSFDWCSNLYRELAFLPDGTVRHLVRSDDYGNSRGEFKYPAGSYPVALLPLVMRALDFSTGRQQAFLVLLEDGSTVPARAELAGPDTIETPEGSREASKIIVHYDAQVPSLIGETADPSETYWRGTAADRPLLKLEAASGHYSMALVEKVRSAYWNENIFPRLEHVHERP